MSHAHPENWPVLDHHRRLGRRAPQGRQDPRRRRRGVRRESAAFRADAGDAARRRFRQIIRSCPWPFTHRTRIRIRPPARTWRVSPSSLKSPTASGVLELAVHPSYRNQGVAGRLLGALQGKRSLDGLKAWSHGNHEAAAELAARFGYGPVRELWKMRLMSSASALPDAGLPDGVSAPRLRAGPGRAGVAGGQPGRVLPPPRAGFDDPGGPRSPEG